MNDRLKYWSTFPASSADLLWVYKTDGPTAGTGTVDPLEFLARLVTNIPDPSQVMQRYSGRYASRTRGVR